MPELIVEFAKMHGAGNDFVVIDNRFFVFSDAELSALATTMCRRRTGIGADGLLALADSDDPGMDFRMKYFNADGSRGGMCGNGARCLVQFAIDAGIESRPVHFETDEGTYSADVFSGNSETTIRLHVPNPSGFKASVSLAGKPPNLLGTVGAIFTGVPHAVCQVPAVKAVPVEEWGVFVRQNEVFPDGTNVNFVEVSASSEKDIIVRTYERGVEAETLACGTGAIASAISTWKAGLVTERPIRVSMPGGVLTVGFKDRNGEAVEVWLEGPAVRVFRGTCPVNL